MFTATRALVSVLGLCALLCAQAPAWADPPPWANAHGDRDDEHGRDHDGDQDHDRDHGRNHGYHGYGGYEGRGGYRGYGGDEWPNDYGVVRHGRCDTDSALTVFGAIAGGVIGNSTASPANRGVATVFGAIAGGIIGNAIGDAIDDGDRACIGHSLELAQLGRPVSWHNPHSHMGWRLMPLRDLSRSCREFDLVREYGGHYGHERVVACRRERGDWEFQGR